MFKNYLLSIDSSSIYIYSETILQSIISIFLIISGFFFVRKISFFFKNDVNRVSIIYLYHLFFSILFFYYSFVSPSDSKGFYTKGIRENFDITTMNFLGSEFIKILVHYLYTLFNFSYFSCFIFFGLLGCVGLIAIDSVIQNISNEKKFINNQISKLLIFFPSLHFWSSSLGKESLIIFSIGILFWSFYFFSKKNLLLIFLSFLIIFIIRPYFGFAIFISFYSSYILFANKDLKYIFLNISFISLIILFIPITYNFLVITDQQPISYLNVLSNIISPNINSIYSILYDYISSKQNLFINSNTSVSLSDKSLFIKIFFFLFMPNIFSFENLFILFVGIENFILLIVIIFLLKNLKIKTLTNFYNFFIFLFIFIIIILLALVTSNLGLANRQKWMIIPILFIFLLSCQSKQKLK